MKRDEIKWMYTLFSELAVFWNNIYMRSNSCQRLQSVLLQGDGSAQINTHTLPFTSRDVLVATFDRGSMMPKQQEPTTMEEKERKVQESREKCKQ